MSEGHGGAKRDSAARLERDACILGALAVLFASLVIMRLPE